MKPDNLDLINRSFEVQASDFESKALQFSKEDYLQYTINAVRPECKDSLLEAAAGTCICGRSFAPFVQSVVCLDATEGMLEVGKREADSLGLGNMTFIRGYVQELPFPDESFDIVFSRLAFHHFTDTETAFSEMNRCLKKGGRLVMIDMEAAQEELRPVQDGIETLRDPSHVRNMSRAEMEELFIRHGLEIRKCETTRIKQRLGSWMALTKTSDLVQREILQKMKTELSGGMKTGFMPYIENDEIRFDQRWIMTIGIKQ